MSEHGAALELDDVARRFVESERALSEARQRLDGLTAAREQAARSSRSLEESAAGMAGFTKAASALFEEMTGLHRQTREVLAAGAEILNGTGFRDLQTNIEGLHDRMNALDAHVGDVKKAEERIEELTTELERRTAMLSSRQRRRVGLTG
jgi:predicted  nucleic acid-binding Zn-ribbon protein